MALRTRIDAWGRWRVLAGVTAVFAVTAIVAAATSPGSGAGGGLSITHPAAVSASGPATAPRGFLAAGGGGAASAGSAQAAGSSGGAVAQPAPEPPIPVPPNPGGGQVNTLVAPKVVENASVDVTIGHGSLTKVVDQLTALAAADSGIVSHTDQSTATGGTPGANMTLRVPASDFASALAQIKAAGKVTDLQTSGNDVTSQYVDLQSRIQALQASRDQYLQILSRASAIGDVLAVQNQLNAVQSQLEQLQGQLNVLNDQATYATIQVALIEALPPGKTQPQPLPQSGLAHAWHNAVAAFTGGFDWLVGISGALGFALLLVLGLGLVGRAAWTLVTRRRRAGHAAPPTPTPAPAA